MGYRSGRRTLLPRETYSSLQTSRRYLRIRLGNKAHPAARDSPAKRLAFVRTTRSNGVPAVLNSLSDFAPVGTTPDRGDDSRFGFSTGRSGDGCGKHLIDPHPFGSTISACATGGIQTGAVRNAG